MPLGDRLGGKKMRRHSCLLLELDNKREKIQTAFLFIARIARGCLLRQAMNTQYKWGLKL
jgi:hypothetical protein